MNASFNNEFHIKIDSIANAISRPTWSVVIPTYNCANYLRESLKSVLNHNYASNHMEIIVVDDHSTKDDPAAVVKEFGNGRIEFIRQSENVGKVRNYETGLLRSKGLFIHILHGDDKVCDGFYEEMERIFNNFPEAKAAFCRSIYVDSKSRWTGITGMIQDEEGIVPKMAEKLYVQQHVQTPSIVVKREVYETIGTFDRRLDCMEDWEMWIRIANSYPFAVSNKVLAQYRTHDTNATNLTFDDGSALNTHKKVFQIVDAYINPALKHKFFKLRNKKQAEFLTLSYKLRKAKLSSSEKMSFIKSIMALNSSPLNLLRLFR